MSMLSAQCDELRSMAESVGLAMPQAATLMMEAADTIDSLDLALDSKRIAERRVTELLDENAKLREEFNKMDVWHSKELTAAMAENAKLRELLAGDETRRRIAGIGEGMVSTYRGTETVDDARLVVENAKLRELVALWIVINKHMSLCATTVCEQCPVRKECGESVYLEGLLGIDPKWLSWRVQERGIEANDG